MPDIHAIQAVKGVPQASVYECDITCVRSAAGEPTTAVLSPAGRQNVIMGGTHIWRVFAKCRHATLATSLHLRPSQHCCLDDATADVCFVIMTGLL
jgi:hypothetical protein